LIGQEKIKMEAKNVIIGVLSIGAGLYFVFNNLYYKVYDDPLIRSAKFKQFFSGVGLIILGIILLFSETLQ